MQHLVRRLNGFLQKQSLQAYQDTIVTPASLEEQTKRCGEKRAVICGLFRSYLEHMRTTKRKQTSISLFEGSLRHMETFKGVFKDLDDRFLDKYSAHLIENNHTNGSIRAQIERLIAVLNFYNIQHNLSFRNFKQFNRKAFHEIQDEILSEKEVDLCWKFESAQPPYPKGRMKKKLTFDRIRIEQFLIGLYTGCRKNELPTIFMTRHDDVETLGYYSSKDGEVRFIPLHPRLKPFIESGHFRMPIAFTSRFFKRLGITGSGQEIKRRGHVVERKAVPRSHIVTFHSARKTFAVRMLAAGVDVYTVSQLLGHNSVDTTLQFYAYISANKRNERVKQAFVEWEKFESAHQKHETI